MPRCKKHVYVDLTLSANPFSYVTSYWVINEMERIQAPGKAGDRLSKEIQILIDNYGLPCVIYDTGSICHTETFCVMFLEILDTNAFAETKTCKAMREENGSAFHSEGIIIIGGNRAYTSMTDTEEVIDDTIARFVRVFSKSEGT